VQITDIFHPIINISSSNCIDINNVQLRKNCMREF